jgi:hypothetical protein
MATASFTKNILVTDPEAVARFVELISQPPKPIPEDLGKDIVVLKTKEEIDLLMQKLSL